VNGFQNRPHKDYLRSFGELLDQDVSLARIAAVAFHRFKIGQQVVATAFGVLTGPYQITRLLPLVSGIPHYRAKRLPNGPESAFSELSLRPMPESADTNGTQAAKSKSRGR
jgi:hypothetical protein